jgi:hypothetical protein
MNKKRYGKKHKAKCKCKSGAVISTNIKTERHSETWAEREARDRNKDIHEQAKLYRPVKPKEIKGTTPLRSLPLRRLF